MTSRRVTTVVLLAATAGCSSVRPVYEPARFISEKNPPVVYVVRQNGAVVAIASPRISGDTVLGVGWESNRAVAVPFSQVYSVAAARFDGTRTAFLIGGVTLASAIAAYAMFGGAHGHNNWYCDYNNSVRGPNGEPLCGPAM
jgi:hypothetical protein